MCFSNKIYERARYIWKAFRFAVGFFLSLLTGLTWIAVCFFFFNLPRFVNLKHYFHGPVTFLLRVGTPGSGKHPALPAIKNSHVPFLLCSVF